MAIELMVMPLARYWAGDYVTPAMRQSWEQGLSYAIVRPHEGIQHLPPEVPFGGPSAPQERLQLAPIVDELQEQVNVWWDDGTDEEPLFHRVDPTAFNALLDEARRRYDRIPGLAGRLMRREPQYSQLGHGTIFVPGEMSDMLSGDGFVVASQHQLQRELDGHRWPAQTESAVRALRAALSEAQRLRLPLIIDF